MQRTVSTWMLIAVAGCIDLGSPPAAEPAGSISGAITYDGVTDRALVVSAWAAVPPVGPPLASVTIEHPTFPQPYTLDGLAPGAAFLTARLAERDGAGEVLGSYPSVDEVSAVVLGEDVGLGSADFALVAEGRRAADAVVHTETRALMGTVEFGGNIARNDVLRGALYLSYPARGAPADLQIVNERNPSFPYDFQFTGVRDGAYYTVFYLDRGGDSVFGPGPDDIVAWATDPGGRPVSTAISLGATRGGVGVVIPMP